ncbi:MAG: hypothetical protein COA79_10795 [Planctomycetota bacterium]|nr:MAG: hypothetical protein COA79_10795 [Planctomycetota bacterium]
MKPLADINSLFQKYCKSTSENNLLEILKQSQKYIFKICFKVLKNQHEAEDATQDVLIKIIQNIHILKKDSKLTSWINQVSLNQAIDYHQKRVKSKLSYQEDLNISDDSSDELLDNVILYEHIGQLPEKEKSLIHYRFVNNLNLDEIAKETNSTTSTVHRQIQKALEVLKVSLKKSGFATLSLSFIPILEEASAVELTTDLTIRLSNELFSHNQTILVSSNTLKFSLATKKYLLVSLLLSSVVTLTLSINYFLAPLFDELPANDNIQILKQNPRPEHSNVNNNINNKQKAHLSEGVSHNKRLSENVKQKHTTSEQNETKPDMYDEVKNKKIDKKYFGVVIDEDSKLPIEGVSVEVYDIFTHKKVVLKTNEEGRYFSNNLSKSPFLYYIRFIKKGFALKITFQEFKNVDPLSILLNKGYSKKYEVIDRDEIPFESGQLISYLPSKLPENHKYFHHEHLSSTQFSASKLLIRTLPSYLRIEDKKDITKDKSEVIFSNKSLDKEFEFRFLYKGYYSQKIKNNSHAHRKLKNFGMKIKSLENKLMLNRPVDLLLKVKYFYTQKKTDLNYLDINYKCINKKDVLLLNSNGELNSYFFGETIPKRTGMSMLSDNLPDFTIDSKYYFHSKNIPVDEWLFNKKRELKGDMIIKLKAKVFGKLIDDSSVEYPNSYILIGGKLLRSDNQAYISESYITPMGSATIWDSNFSNKKMFNTVPILSGGSYNIENVLKRKTTFKFKLQVLISGRPLVNVAVIVSSVKPNEKLLSKEFITDKNGVLSFDGFVSSKYKFTFSVIKNNYNNNIKFFIESKKLSQVPYQLNLKQKVPIKLSLEGSALNSLKEFNFQLKKEGFDFISAIRLTKAVPIDSIVIHLPEIGSYELSCESSNKLLSHHFNVKSLHVGEIEKEFKLKIYSTEKNISKVTVQIPKKIYLDKLFRCRLGYDSKGGYIIISALKELQELDVYQGSTLFLEAYYKNGLLYSNSFKIPKTSKFNLLFDVNKPNCVKYNAHKLEHALIFNKFRENDIILNFNGERIINTDQIEKIYDKLSANRISVEIIRKNENVKLEIPSIRIQGLSNHYIKIKN